MSGELINKVLRWAVSYKGHKDYGHGAPSVSWREIGVACGLSKEQASVVYETSIGNNAAATVMLPVITEYLDNEGML